MTDWRAWAVVLLCACAGPPSTDPEAPTDADADADPDSDSDTDTDTDADTGTDPCAPDPSLPLVATAAPGPSPTQLALTVDVGADATVAALCTADADPEEAHLVEGATPARHHELRFSGLLADTAYTCRVAATCPTTGAAPLVVRSTTGAPPIDFPTLEVEVDPELGMTGEYTLAPWQARIAQNTYAVVWDAEGRPRWWWRMPEEVQIPFEVLLDPGTTRLVWGGGNHREGRPTVVDLWDGEVYKADLPAWDVDHYTHDTKRIADGRILSLLYVPNTDGRVEWQGFGIRLHDPATDTIGFELDSQRYVDDGTLGPANAGNDPYHANWVDWIDGPTGPVLYVSLYGVRRILAIDGTTGAILWDLGAGRGWTVLDADGSPLPDVELPQGQHGLEVEGDELLVYDNGVLRRESRAERWRIEPGTKTATRLWSWTEPGFFEPICGDVDDLGGGRILVTKATAGCCGQPLDIAEVDVATGRVASRLSMPDDRMLGYRSQRYDGCALFARTSACPARAERAGALAPLLGP